MATSVPQTGQNNNYREFTIKGVIILYISPSENLNKSNLSQCRNGRSTQKTLGLFLSSRTSWPTVPQIQLPALSHKMATSVPQTGQSNNYREFTIKGVIILYISPSENLNKSNLSQCRNGRSTQKTLGLLLSSRTSWPTVPQIQLPALSDVTRTIMNTDG